jgi:hypothetical protein
MKKHALYTQSNWKKTRTIRTEAQAVVEAKDTACAKVYEYEAIIYLLNCLLDKDGGQEFDWQTNTARRNRHWKHRLTLAAEDIKECLADVYAPVQVAIDQTQEKSEYETMLKTQKENVTKA